MIGIIFFNRRQYIYIYILYIYIPHIGGIYQLLPEPEEFIDNIAFENWEV